MTTRETRSAVGGVPGSPSDAWVVKGTRVPLWSVFANLTEGRHRKGIHAMVPRGRECQVMAVLEHEIKRLDATVKHENSV